MERFYAGPFAFLAWFVVVGSYVIGHNDSLASTVDYFSYFTTLSNMLVAATFAASAIAPESTLGRFLLRPPVALATVTYIACTGLVFYFMLSALYAGETGLARAFNYLHHYVIPPAFVLFWLLWIPKGTLGFRSVLWMLVPGLGYAAWTLVHGPFSGFYPYPFVDIAKLGWGQVLLNVVEFVVFFALVGTVFLLVDRVIGRFARRG